MAKHRSIEYRPIAINDIESAILYMSLILKNKKAATDWYNTLKSKLELLRDQPELGRLFEDERLEAPPYRSFLFDNWRILYSFTDDALTVWRVLNCRQDIGNLGLVEY